ncbi:MAG: O-antigen ligase family protein [Candidatus Thorarchaeota archaeon]
MLTKTDIVGSGLISLDKLIKPLLIFLIVIVLLSAKRPISIDKNIVLYILPSFIFLFILSAHYFYSNGHDPANTMRAFKEIIRLASFLSILIICSTVTLSFSDLRFMTYMIALLGIPLGISSLIDSLTRSTIKTWKYVEGYLRAGTEIVDPNALAAVLNISSLCALSCFLIVRRYKFKLLLLLAFVVGQAGRFATFSTGSFISIILSLLIFSFFIGRYQKKLFINLFLVIIVIMLIFSIILMSTDLTKTIFYRVLLSDEIVYKATVGNRVDQYMSLIKIAINEPYTLIFGTGTVLSTEILDTKVDFHNSYIRPLLVAGVLGFISIIWIWLITLIRMYRAIKIPHLSDNDLIILIAFFSGFVGWSFQAATLPSDTSVIHWFFIILGYQVGLSRINTSKYPGINQ